MYEEKKLYTIGEVSSICHIPVSTLRYYNKIGLINPSVINEFTGYRYYDDEKIFQTFLVKYLRALPLPLSSIKSILEANQIGYLKEQIKMHLNVLEKEIETLNWIHLNLESILKRLDETTSLLNHIEKNKLKNITPTIEFIPKQDIIFIRHRLEAYCNDEAHVDLWAKLLDLVQREQAIMTGPLFVNYHVSPLEQFYTNVCDYELGIPVIGVKEINKKHHRVDEAFEAVVTYHVGSYDLLIHPYLMCMQWIHENGYEVSGSMRDSFLISPIHTQNINEHVTKIIIPVKKAE